MREGWQICINGITIITKNITYAIMIMVGLM